MSVEVFDRSAQHRYEILVDGELVGFAAYRVVEPDRWLFTHTEINTDQEHQGLGTMLVAEAMADAQRRGIRVLPQCPFVREYLAEHPEVAVVAAEDRPKFRL